MLCHIFCLLKYLTERVFEAGINAKKSLKISFQWKTAQWRAWTLFIGAYSLVSVKMYAELEQRQYKNDSIQSNVIPALNLPRFFTT